MGMDSYVKGLKQKTEEYEKKLNIYKSCEELEISVPKEILDFFDGEICEEGIIVELPKEAIREEYDDGIEFIEIDLSKLPKDIAKIRFVNSY